MAARWLRFLGLTASTSHSRRNAKVKRPKSLSLERLEDRTVPTAVAMTLTTSTKAVVAASYFDSAVYEFDSNTGALLQTLVAPNSQSVLVNPSAMVVGPDGNLYFASQSTNSIVEYNFGTQTLSTLINLPQLGTSVTDPPAGLAFGPDGNLYVSVNNGPEAFSGGAVYRFNITSSGGQLAYTGTYAAIDTSLIQPTELTFGTNSGDGNNLYVSDDGSGTVVKITNAIGASPSASTFISAGSGGLVSPSGLTWGTNGQLYVTDLGSYQGADVGQVLEYNADGAFDQVFTQANTLLYQFPSDAVVLSNGNVLTANLGGSYPFNTPGVSTEDGGGGTSGSIDEFNANGTFNHIFTSSAFPNDPSTGVTNISPTQLALITTAPTGSTIPLAQGTVDSVYNQTITANGGFGSVTLTVSNIQNAIPGLTVPSSGTTNLDISGTPTATGTETFTVTATDGAGDRTSMTYDITVNPAPNPAITLTSGPLPGDIVGNAYNQSINASGGSGAISLTVSNVQNAIPGISIPGTGTGSLNVTGSPTATGTETFTVTATDALGATTSTTYTITVNGSTLTLNNIPADTVGVAYSQSITATGGVGTIIYTVSNIQNAVPGLTINGSGTSNLTITGTPTAAGNETFTVTATDSAGDTTAGTYSTSTVINFDSGLAVHLAGGADDEYTSYTQGGFVVLPDPAVDGPGAHFHMTSQGLYTHIHDDELGGDGIVLVQRSDGGAFILNSLTVPQLSSGGSLTFADSAGDTMTVTEAGTYTFNWGPITSFTITPSNILDSLNQTGFVDDITVSNVSNYSLLVNPAITVSPTPLPAGNVNMAYNQTIAVYGGTGLINLVASNIQNAIPGLVVEASDTGNLIVSGTPTATGTETFTITATDALGATTTTTYSIAVNPSPTPLNLNNIPADTVGVPYDQSITATGGVGTITYSVSNIRNAIPGLTINGSGTSNLTITGTPTAAGTETFTVTATDSVGDTTTTTYSTATTINFDSGTYVHLAGGDLDAYTSYTQDGFVVTPDVALDGAGAHFHADSTGLFTHIHDDEPGGPGVVLMQRSDGGAFLLDSLTIPEIYTGTSSTGSLTFTDSTGDTITITSPGTYTFNWGPITWFTITPNNIYDSQGGMGYVNDIVVSNLSNYALTVNPVETLTPSPLPSGTVGVAYNSAGGSPSITTVGGTGLVNVVVTNIQNAIPGLTISGPTDPLSGPALSITGTATAAGTETFTVTATDALGVTTVTDYSFTVNPSQTLTLNTIPADTVGVPYDQSITATDGVGTITYTVSNIQNAVPGLTINGSGTSNLTITGTPTAAGTENFTVTATDAYGDTTTNTYSTTTTLNFDSGTLTHLAGGDLDAYTNYLQDGYSVSPDVAIDGPGAHEHIDSTGMFTHIHDDELGGAGVIIVQRTDGAPFLLDSLTVPSLSSGGSLTFTDSNGDTFTATATGTYTFNWGPITSFTITPNNIYDSQNEMGYVNDIVVSGVSNYTLVVNAAPTLTPSPLPAGTVGTAYNAVGGSDVTAYGGTG